MAIRRGRRAATGFLADFHDFIMRGNVIDLAVAVIIGGAFGKIIDSFVTDIVTPILLNPALKAAGVDKIENYAPNGIKVGVFLAAVLNFLVISFVLFLLIRSFEAAKRRFVHEQATDPEAAPLDPVIASQQELTAAIDTLTQAIRSRT